MIFIIILEGGPTSVNDLRMSNRIKPTITDKIIWEYYTSFIKPASTLSTNNSKESIIALTPL